MLSDLEEVAPCSLPPHRHDYHQHDAACTTNSSPDDEDEDFINDPVDVTASVHGNSTPHLAIHEDIAFTNNDNVEVATTTQQTSRVTNYSENEILILACVWIKVSTDPAARTDQKSAAFWQRISIYMGSLWQQQTIDI